MSGDPWKYRNANLLCRTCWMFVEKAVSTEGGIGKIEGDDRGHIGRCRKHAPTMTGYPVVFETDWCGDHKVDENKI